MVVVLLVIEAAACATMALLREWFAGIFPSVQAFPFQQIGVGLRALSLTGQRGNAASVGLFLVIGLLPIIALALMVRRRKLFPEDALLVLLSPLLLGVMYVMVNPTVLGAVFGKIVSMGGQDGATMCKGIASVLVYSLLIAYAVLRLLRLFRTNDRDRLSGYLSVMVTVFIAVLIVAIFGVGLAGLLQDLPTALARYSLPPGTVVDVPPGVDETWLAEQLGLIPGLGIRLIPPGFVILRFVVNQLPYALDIAILAMAWRLLVRMRADRYSDESVTAARSLSRLCVVSVAVMALVSLGFNLVQVGLARWLTSVKFSAVIPMTGMALALVTLLVTRLVTENKQLQDDNDMFI